MENIQEKQNNILNKSQRWLIVGIILIIASPLFFIFIHFFDFSLTDSGTIGDTIGGITSPITGLIGAILVYYAFLIQLEANKMLYDQIAEEKKERKKQQIENHFFELLHIHIDHQNNLKINDIKNQTVLQGKEVFQWMLREFYEYYQIINDYFIQGEKDITIPHKIDIAYTCFLYGGVGEFSFQFIQEQLKKYNDLELSEWIKTHFEKRKKAIQRKYPFKLFNGHHARIGHYFAHLYQTIKYINSQEEISYSEKYNYVKTLRAQLGPHEQTLLFFLSLTDHGIKWEKAEQLNEDKHLITKYNLIKDIPEGYITITRIKQHYPNVNFNNKGNTLEKVKLIETYT